MTNLEITGIRWHPGFYGAAELEFLENKKDLEFQREYNLSKEPIRIDLLIIKKLSEIPIRNELGHIFKKYNVVEYKSPDDGLSIDDYYKTIGYACLYKGLGETVDQIPAEEITVSIFRESYPRELFAKLKGSGSDIKEHFPGIYYITGQKITFDTQVIVISRLNKEMHYSLRILSRNVQEEDVEGFLKEAVMRMEPGEKNNVDAVLQVSVFANQEVYEKIRRHDEFMCDALKELMKEDFDKIRDEYTEKIKEEKEKTLLETIKNLMESMKLTAEQAMTAIKIPDVDQKNYLAKL